LVGPTEIAGYYSNLVHGLRATGCDVIYGIIHSNHFAYGKEHPQSSLRRICLDLWLWSERHRSHRLIWLLARLSHQLLVILYFLFWFPRLDVVIFGFGHSFLPFNLDLPLLRLFGKTVIVNLGHGSEMRPPYVDGSYLLADGSSLIPARRLIAIAKRMRSRVRWFEQWATFVIGAPLSSSLFATKPYINWFAIGIPFADSNASGLSRLSEQAFLESRTPLRIIHAPSKPVLKGTAAIRQAICNLQRRGFLIDYREIQGKPNSEVLAELQHCDLVVDQLFSDTPMAALAVEAAFWGKPSLVGGYGLNELKQLLPSAWCPPTFTCHPSALEATLERLLMQPELLRQVGAQARDFVANRWRSTLVAQRYLGLIKRNFPGDWWFDPSQLRYLHGCGLPESQVSQSVAEILHADGLQGLQLSSRPDLEQAYLEFAGSLLSSPLD